MPKLSKENLHHVYLLSSEREVGEIFIKKFLEQDLNLEISGNPDIHFEQLEMLGIDDARSLKERGSKKPLGDKQFFIIAFNFITVEAQNALLKLFEEPAADTHFFLITTTPLLPTVKSRLITLSLRSDHDVSEAEEFLAADVDKRLKMVERFKDSENENKKSELLAFANGLEQTLSENLSKNTEIPKTLGELLELKKYLFDRAPSVKMIAEYLALRLPRFK